MREKKSEELQTMQQVQTCRNLQAKTFAVNLSLDEPAYVCPLEGALTDE